MRFHEIDDFCLSLILVVSDYEFLEFAHFLKLYFSLFVYKLFTIFFGKIGVF